ncbi:hypothetical protein N431DRAFT_440150 [Stipitochalara longipes BDJ]|nr:hypothetical protein N431DRAFT_440150 [Stipitochalara longipes BDJ]
MFVFAKHRAPRSRRRNRASQHFTKAYSQISLYINQLETIISISISISSISSSNNSSKKMPSEPFTPNNHALPLEGAITESGANTAYLGAPSCPQKTKKNDTSELRAYKARVEDARASSTEAVPTSTLVRKESAEKTQVVPVRPRTRRTLDGWDSHLVRNTRAA